MSNGGKVGRKSRRANECAIQIARARAGFEPLWERPVDDCFDPTRRSMMDSKFRAGSVAARWAAPRTAQIRRDLTMCRWHISGAPRFSPYLCVLCVGLRLFVSARTQKLFSLIG